MNKELINKLIQHAKKATENAFCPSSGVPEGCSLLVEGSVIFSGCNIEFSTLSSSLDAGQVAMAKAISEGENRFITMCLYSEKTMPYPSGTLLQLLSEFNPNIGIIVASDETFTVHSLHELLPIRRLVGVED